VEPTVICRMLSYPEKRGFKGVSKGVESVQKGGAGVFKIRRGCRRLVRACSDGLLPTATAMIFSAEPVSARTTSDDDVRIQPSNLSLGSAASFTPGRCASGSTILPPA